VPSGRRTTPPDRRRATCLGFARLRSGPEVLTQVPGRQVSYSSRYTQQPEPVWEYWDVQPTANLAVTSSREAYRALPAAHRRDPVTRKVLADSETPLSAYRKLAANRPGTYLLESAENGRSWSRWSFIGAGTPAALTVRDGQAVWLGTTPHDAPAGG